MPAGAPMPPWADLELGLVANIAACCALEDYTSCRGVCAAWRAALPPPRSRPLAVLPADDAAGLPVSLAACSLHARRWCRLPQHRAPGGRVGAAARCRCVGASRDGWLALVAGDAEAPAGPVLFHPFTGEEIPLDESLYQPAHGQLEPKIVFSPNPTRRDFTAASLVRPGMVAVQRAADGCSYSEDTGPFLDGVVLVDIAYGGDGKVYCLASDGMVHVLHLTRRQRVCRRMPPMEVGPLLPIGADAFPPPYDAISEHTNCKNLVLCEGVLYQVWRRSSGSGSVTINTPLGGTAWWIRIFAGDVFVLRYDPENWCWAVVDAKDLRGNAVFLGMNDAAVVRGEGVRANNIYYWDGPREGDGDYEAVVYNVATRASIRWPPASTGGVSCPVWYFLPAAGVSQRVGAETAGVEAMSGQEATSVEHDEEEEDSAYCFKKTMNLLAMLDLKRVGNLVVAEETLDVGPDGEGRGTQLVQGVEDGLGHGGVQPVDDVVVVHPPVGIALCRRRRGAHMVVEAEIAKDGVQEGARADVHRLNGGGRHRVGRNVVVGGKGGRVRGANRGGHGSGSSRWSKGIHKRGSCGR